MTGQLAEAHDLAVQDPVVLTGSPLLMLASSCLRRTGGKRKMLARTLGAVSILRHRQRQGMAARLPPLLFAGRSGCLLLHASMRLVMWAHGSVLQGSEMFQRRS